MLASGDLMLCSVGSWIDLGAHCGIAKLRSNNLQANGVRFIATSQNIDTDESNPTSRFLLHVLMAAAEFERELIHERSVLGQKRYRAQYEAGKVGKEVHSKSRKDLPVGRPRRIFARERVPELRAQGYSYRHIAKQLGIGEGTVRRVRTGKEPNA